jgi:hypothetical protein
MSVEWAALAGGEAYREIILGFPKSRFGSSFKQIGSLSIVLSDAFSGDVPGAERIRGFVTTSFDCLREKWHHRLGRLSCPGATQGNSIELFALSLCLRPSMI